jgi:hypothetical protein
MLEDLTKYGKVNGKRRDFKTYLLEFEILYNLLLLISCQEDG